MSVGFKASRTDVWKDVSEVKKRFRVSKIIVLICVTASCFLMACGDDASISVPPVAEGNIGGEQDVTAVPEMTAEPESITPEPTTIPVAVATRAPELTGTAEPVVTQPAFTAEPTVTSEPEPTATPGTVQIVISAAGDVTLGNYLGQGYSNSFDDTYAQGVGDAYFFENVADIFAADSLTLVNLEGPLTDSEEPREGQTFTISGAPEYVNILLEGNVEAVSMANNHRMDYLEKGTEDTVAALTEAGIVYAYDDVVGVYEVDGIQIGMISVNEVNEGWLVEAKIQSGIEKLKEAGADLIIVSCHWGVEKENYPEEYQTKLGRKCVTWGADLVIGHHPHVLQGIEEYKGKYIVYSLGNFCFGANRNPTDKDCMIFQQTFTFEAGELQADKDIRVIPCSISSTTKRNDYKPTPAEGKEAKRIIGRINEYSAEFGLEFDDTGVLIAPDSKGE